MPQEKPDTPASISGPGKIIAVGGAKGGIGKSLFVANLGVLLSQMGKRIVLVDLDLGGSNLHLYMGVWSLTSRIDDFLDKNVENIHDILTPTKYGPLLIGGGGGKLGAANIHYSRKQKLLKAIKTIDADYVILDLGGDTTYNILDFYLSADQGFVLTTCDPASYLDAYGFIKTSLYRKLTRLFSPESSYYNHRDGLVDQLIKDHIFTNTADNGNRIDALLDALVQEKPVYHGIIKGLLDNFRPGVVVTMVEKEDQAVDLITRLRKVSGKILSVELNHFGCVPFEKSIQQSAKELVPSVAKAPDGTFAKALRRIALKMEMA
ncbi:Putative heat shock protein related to DnaJ (fragment) [Desulfosarcina cetonica]|uniref:nucleotide-binding protein n=1 Tax=Desulfosarcina cetonica TaxID=90730 RepID=UPI0006D0B8D0